MKTHSVPKIIYLILLCYSLETALPQISVGNTNDTLRFYDSNLAGRSEYGPFYMLGCISSYTGDTLFQIANPFWRDQTTDITTGQFKVRAYYVPTGELLNEVTVPFKTGLMINLITSKAIKNINNKWVVVLPTVSDSVAYYEIMTGKKLGGFHYGYFTKTLGLDYWFSPKNTFCFVRDKNDNIKVFNFNLNSFVEGVILQSLTEKCKGDFIDRDIGFTSLSNDSVSLFQIPKGNVNDSIIAVRYNLVTNKVLDTTKPIGDIRLEYDTRFNIFKRIVNNATKLIVYVPQSNTMFEKTADSIANAILCGDGSIVAIENEKYEPTYTLDFWSIKDNKLLNSVKVVNTNYNTFDFHSVKGKAYDISPDGSLMAYLIKDSVKVFYTSTGKVHSVYQQVNTSKDFTDADFYLKFLSNSILVFSQPSVEPAKNDRYIINLKTKLKSQPTLFSVDDVNSTNEFYFTRNNDNFAERRSTSTFATDYIIPKNGIIDQITGFNFSTNSNKIITGGITYKCNTTTLEMNRIKLYSFLALPDFSKFYPQYPRNFQKQLPDSLPIVGYNLDTLGYVPQRPHISFIGASGDSKLLLTADSANTLAIRDAETLSITKQLTKVPGIYTASFTPNNKVLVTTTTTGNVELWYVETGNHRTLVETNINFIQSYGFSETGKYIKTNIGLIDTTDGLIISIPNGLRFISPHNMGMYNHDSIMIGGFENKLLKFNVTTGDFMFYNYNGNVFCHSTTPTFIVTGENGTEYGSIYNSETMKRIRTAPKLKSATAFGWSHDGAILASVDSSYRVTIWKPRDNVTGVEETPESNTLQSITVRGSSVRVPLAKTAAFISIYSIIGELIQKVETDNIRENFVDVNVSMYSQGMYYVVISYKDLKENLLLEILR